MQGELEGVANGAVMGWLWEAASPQAHVQFSLLVNGVEVGTYFADHYRRDLQLKQIGEGDHGFELAIDAAWLLHDVNSFSIRVGDRELGQALVLEVSRAGERIASRPSLVPTGDSSGTRGLGMREPVRPYSLLADGGLTLPVPGAALSTTVARDRVQSLLIELIKGKVSDAKAANTLVTGLFTARRYDDICLLGPPLLAQFPREYPLRNELGRSLLYCGHLSHAAQVLEEVRVMFPSRHGAIFYLGAVYQRQRRFAEALEVFEECLKQSPEEGKYAFEAGRAAVNLAFGDYGSLEQEPERLTRAFALLEAAHQLLPADPRPARELAVLHLAGNRLAEARSLADQAVTRDRGSPGAWQVLAQVAIRQGDIAAAEGAFHAALELAPQADWPRFGLRLTERLLQATAGEQDRSLARIKPTTTSDGRGMAERLLDQLAAEKTEWVSFGDADAAIHAEWLDARAFQWAAAVAGTDPTSPTEMLWRRLFLVRLLETHLFDATATLDAFLEQAARYGAMSGPSSRRKRVRGKARVLLVSAYGPRKFGGAEQFLGMMAGLYRKLGFEVLLVGTRAEMVGETGIADGFRYTFVANDPVELFKLAIRQQAAVVHVVSGLGYEVSAALRYLDTAMIFGVHFWRELFQNPTPALGYYPDIDKGGETKPEFQTLIADSAAVYANSQFTRDVIECEFQVRTSVLYSLPADLDVDVTSPEARRGVLLANARFDKGFGMLLAVAELLPHLPFTAIASQSEAVLAQAETDRRGLRNVTVLTRQADMAPLYRSMRAVMVPSFQFVETFSRVVIEAHRYGLPVVGSDRGNVPVLLQTSGVALPEEPALWAAELDRLCGDDDYWRERSARALENSTRYQFRTQRRELQQMVKGARRPVLVGVGSGLGNILHTTPLIRNIATKLGQRIDVVVAADHQGLLFAVDHPEYVNHVFPLSDVVTARRYDTVFLSHSFGAFTPRFSAREVLRSRDWDQFRPEHSLHEAEFNLAAAEALMGLSYDPEDVLGYFIGDYRYDPPQQVLVGLHGGSKDGAWATKRWPGFPELAARLHAQGYTIASFGTASEYVPGTVDMTGGTIEEMTRRMMACSHFVANDSGVMNIANALGIPLIALFGPTNVTTRGPLRSSSVAIALRKDCAPCEMHTSEAESRFRSGACVCIGEISVDQVMEVLMRMLRPHRSGQIAIYSGADLLSY